MNIERFKLPDYAIVGMQRSGTTSLFLYATAHPQMHGMMWDRQPNQARPHAGDEIHYYDYDRHYAKGLGWYASHIHQYDGVVGDKSPTYLHCHHAAERMAQDLPDIKLLVMLRNPVDRAYSHYWKARQVGYETLPTFEAALDAEPERLASDALGDFENSARHLHAYVERGQYVDHLMHWFAYFPGEQFFIIQSEVFWADPERTLRELWGRLGLFQPGNINISWERHQKTAPKPPMQRETRERLEAHFAPYNRALENLLGRKFEGWAT